VNTPLQPKPARGWLQRLAEGPAAAWWIAGLTVLANAALVWVLWRTGYLETGTYEYDTIARNLAAGHGFVLTPGEEKILWRPPLYVWLLAGLYRVTENPYPLAMAVQIVCQAVAGVLVFRIGRSVFNARAGLLAALGLAVYPLFAVNCVRLMPESLFAALVAAITLVLANGSARRQTPWTVWAGAGVLMGLAALLKASIQFLPFFLLVAAPALFRRTVPPASTVRRFLIAAGVMALVIAPWTVRNYRVAGECIPIDTSGGYTFWVGNRLETRGLDDDPLPPRKIEELNRDVARILAVPYTSEFSVAKTAWASGRNSRKLYVEGIRAVLRRPFRWAALAGVKIYRLWFSYIGVQPRVQTAVLLLQAPLLVCAGWGLCCALRRRKPVWPVILPVVYFHLLHAASTANARYSVPLMPHALILAAFALDRLLARGETPS